MISWFSKLMDRAVDAHFRKDPGGRLVFVPETKGKCYFVDSKFDEEKIRAFVKMYRSAIQIISWLAFPSMYFPAIILDDFAGLTPRAHRMAFSLGIPLSFWLVLIALMLIIWALYRQAVPCFTASLSEVGPELKGQLSPITPRPRWRALALVCFVAGMVVVVLGVLIAVQYRPRKKGTCPPQEHACHQVEVDSAHPSRPES